MWIPEPDRWKLNLKDAWQVGRESGYPWCDRLWFLVRGWTCNEVLGWGPQRRVFEWLQRFEFYRNFSHVPCPVHFFLAALRLYKPRYGVCRPCDWTQLVSPPASGCSKCRRMLRPLQKRHFKIKVQGGKTTMWAHKRYVGKEEDLDS